jgi:cob(I)alamin adenosyltransferase
MLSGDYRIVILDEINLALYFKLLTRAEVEGFLKARPADVELVLTGRKAPAWLRRRADLVTEMREVKHYYAVGVGARRGIED